MGDRELTTRPSPPSEDIVGLIPEERVDLSMAGEPIRREEMILNMGPQHPSTHGVLRVELRVQGEIVREVKFHIGYLHRCHESLSELYGYIKGLPLSDRLDYVGAVGNEWAEVNAYEALAGIEAPPRAQYLRTIAMELNRIASHLLFTGAMGLDVGAWTIFLHVFRERENALDLLELMSGARFLYHYIRIGGVAYDIPPDFKDKVLRFCDDMEIKLRDYHDLFSNNEIFRKRAIGVGILPQDWALAYGVSGPIARASGLMCDIRKTDPYGVYDELDFDVPLGKNCDTYDRYWVRMKEIEQSVRILRQAVDRLPEGPITAEMKGRFRPAEGWSYGHAEGARGEVGYYAVSDGTEYPYRLKVRSPCFCNLQGFEKLMSGWLLADVIAILGTLDMVMGCVDR